MWHINKYILDIFIHVYMYIDLYGCVCVPSVCIVILASFWILGGIQTKNIYIYIYLCHVCVYVWVSSMCDVPCVPMCHVCVCVCVDGSPPFLPKGSLGLWCCCLAPLGQCTCWPLHGRHPLHHTQREHQPNHISKFHLLWFWKIVSLSVLFLKALESLKNKDFGISTKCHAMFQKSGPYFLSSCQAKM